MKVSTWMAWIAPRVLLFFLLLKQVACLPPEPIPVPEETGYVLRGGTRVVPKAGTQLDEDELLSRNHLTASLSTPEGSWQLQSVILPREDLLAKGFHERNTDDGRLVWVSTQENDDDNLADCHALLPVAGEQWLLARRPGKDKTCNLPTKDLNWLPEVSLAQKTNSSSLTDERSLELAFGAKVGSFLGVDAYSNGNTGYNSGVYSAYGLKWQCVEYCNRFGVLKGGLANLKGTGHAKSYYTTASSKGLIAYPNGGTMAPAVGDLLPSAGGPYGHIAVVREIGSSFIKVIHQNWSNTSSDNSMTLKMTVSGGKYTVAGFSNTYPVQGWLRKAPKVSSITPTEALLNKVTTFTVKGTNLPPTLAAWVDGCQGLQMLSVASSEAKFRCTPSWSKGTKKGVLKTHPGGITLREWSLQVK